MIKKTWVITLIIFMIFHGTFSYADSAADNQAYHLLQSMSLKEKIGQKLMLDFRYWCDTKPQDAACMQDFTKMNPVVKQIISENHLGGIILFANNLKDVAQIVTLTTELQQAIYATDNWGLLIGTDQEGGIVARLPRAISVSFPGNMAIAAAYLGNPQKTYSAAVGSALAADLKAVGINTDFAPDVDVNVNPLNPVIHVRAFSDDPKLVVKLGLAESQAMQAAGIASTLKHFPGHGDTVTDSHVGLPVVDHDFDQAWAVDLYPYRNIIKKNPPDFIMTAHIQFPALDDSHTYAGKAAKEIITPATLSRRIQHDLLRTQLGYQGIIITDALDMGAIAQNFDATDATIKAFQAGVDIALMPVAVATAADADKLSALIAEIEAAVLAGRISETELNQSVLRILKLKIKLGLLQPDSTSLAQKIMLAQKVLADKDQHKLESDLANDAVTLVQNKHKLLPIKLLPGMRIHILTPWLEQGAGMAVEINRLQQKHILPQNLQISFAKMADTDFAAEKQAIDNADIVIVGHSSDSSVSIAKVNKLTLTANLPPMESLVFPDLLNGDSETSGLTNPYLKRLVDNPPDNEFAFQVLQYAKDQHKKTIFISLLAPYDLPFYASVADAMLAGYDYYGYLGEQGQGYYRGPSMQALTQVIFGVSHASAKLPVNIPNPALPDEMIYPRGFGLTI